MTRQRDVAIEGVKESPADLLSSADIEIDSFICDGLQSAFPRDGLVSEEGGVHEGIGEAVWILDPVDGTSNYVRGLPGWAVSLALRSADGDLGVVYSPQDEELLVAVRGYGVSRQGRSPSNARSHGNAVLVSTGFPYATIGRRRMTELVPELVRIVDDVKISGSCAYDLLQLASGRLDGYMRSDLNIWDVAAGQVILVECGISIYVQATASKPVTDVAWVVAAREPLFGRLLGAAGLSVEASEAALGSGL